MIRVLDPSTTMKIAAGEVVERPASAVRELIDNSLDAGATWIEIQIEKGGREFLSVFDNGVGMAADDLQKAYLNHATSKILSFDDLNDLHTFGFRGEALASLAEIACLTLASFPKEAEFGQQLNVCFGKPEVIQPKGMNPGTQIIVTKFFQNVPARLKFLGTDTSEYRAIIHEFFNKALACPNVAFEVSHNKEKKYHLNEARDLKYRIIDLFPELSEVLHPFSYQEEGIHAYGFLSNPSWYKSNRSYQYLFVNGRAIEWQSFRQQISVAYNTLLPPSKFPAVFCYVEVDPSKIDYNVHPQKREIRFENDRLISDVVRRAIRLGLEKASSVSFETYSETLVGSLSTAQESLSRYNNSNQHVGFCSSGNTPREYKASAYKPFSEKDRGISKPKVEQLQELFQKQEHTVSMVDVLLEAVYIGTCFHTYLIFEFKDRMYLVDFHAIHERIRYMHLITKKEQQLDSQTTIPFILELAQHEAESFEQKQSFLEKLGFQMHRIGDQSFSIEAVPAIIEYTAAKQILIEIFSAELDTQPWDEACKMVACKGSVKSGDTLSKEEIHSLLISWKTIGAPPSCPHGRPIVISLDKRFFDKEFKRTGF